MSRKVQNKVLKERQSTLEKLENMHPYKLMLLLGMIGSGLIFLFMLIAYAVSIPPESEFELSASVKPSLPKAFFISTLLILLAHFFIQPIKPLFYQSKVAKAKWQLALVIFLSFTFLVAQLYAWYGLKQAGIIFTGSAADSFLYVITGLHATHLIAAVVFAFAVYYQMHIMQNDGVKYLIAETNPFWEVQLDMLQIIWLFLDVVWLVFFLFFFFNY